MVAGRQYSAGLPRAPQSGFRAAEQTFTVQRTKPTLRT